MKSTIALLFCVIFSSEISAQMNMYKDPALAYNMIMGTKGSRGKYIQVGAFKVEGSPYIYSESLRGDIYYNSATVKNAEFRINNYDKTIEIVTTEPGKYFIVSVADLDSFSLKTTKNSSIISDLVFYSGTKIDPSNNSFLQLLYKDTYFKLYKSYKTELDMVSTNYIQSDLREFKLNVVYYYTTTTDPKKLIELKDTRNGLQKQFKGSNAKAILADMDLNGNKDVALATFFSKLEL